MAITLHCFDFILFSPMRGTHRALVIELGNSVLYRHIIYFNYQFSSFPSFSTTPKKPLIT